MKTVQHSASNAMVMGSILREWMNTENVYLKVSAKCINVNLKKHQRARGLGLLQALNLLNMTTNETLKKCLN